MTKQELLADKAEIEAGLTNPNVPEAAKAGMRDALETIKSKLAGLEKPATVPPPVSKPKTPASPPARTAAKKPSNKPTAKRDAVYAALSKAHPGLTVLKVTKLGDAEHRSLKDTMKQTAIKAGAGNMAGVWVANYLKNEIERAKKPAAKAPAQKKAAKPAAKSKPKQSGFSFSAQASKEITDAAKPIALHGLKAILVKAETAISQASTIKPGEYAVFTDSGKFFTKLTKESYEKMTRQPAKPAATDTKLKTENEELKKELAVCKAELNKLKKAAQKPAAAPKSDPAKPATSAKTAQKEPPKKKRANCSTSALNMGQLTAKMIRFVKQETKKGWFGTNREIDGLYLTKGDNAVLLAKIVKWDLSKKVTWYRICPETFNKTRAGDPGPGTYKRIVTEKKLKELYTTNEPQAKVYQSCASIYRAFYECSKAGNCNAEMREKIKKTYHGCGDLYKKGTVVPAYMREYHQEVKSNRRPGESYADAMIRTSRELKTARKAA